MSDKQPQGDARKKRKRNKPKKKKGKDSGGAQGMDIQFSVDVPAPEDTSAALDDKELIVDVSGGDLEHGVKISTTETMKEEVNTFDINELPEDVRQEMIQGMTDSNVTVVINGHEVQLPPGVSIDSLSEEEIAKLLPMGESDGSERVIEVTKTIVTEEGTEGHSTEVVTETIVREEGTERHATKVVTETIVTEEEEEGTERHCTELVMETINTEEGTERHATSVVTETIVTEAGEEGTEVVTDTVMTEEGTEEHALKVATETIVTEERGEGHSTEVVTEAIVTEDGEEQTEGHSTELVIRTDTTNEHACVDDPNSHQHETEEVRYIIDALEDHSQPDIHFDQNAEDKYAIEVVSSGLNLEDIDKGESKSTNIEITTTTTVSSEDSQTEDDNAQGSNVVVDVLTSPWKIDRDVEEIAHHNKRVRMTKITRSRRVIITKTADGDEVETVVEEEDDEENPEVIGEIGEFDDSHNETIEIQKVVKKRRVIVTKTADGEEITTVVEDDQTPIKEGIESQGHEIDRHVERTTIVKTRRVIITKNEFGEDEETVVEDDEPIPIELKVSESKSESDDDIIETVETVEVQAEPFHAPDLSPTVTIDTDTKPFGEFVTTEQHYIVHEGHKGVETHQTEEKVEISIKVTEDSHEEIIAEAVESNVVESEVDLKAVLGEPDESHLKALEEQQEKHTLTIHTSAGGHQHESSSDEEEHGANHPSEDKEVVLEHDVLPSEHIAATIGDLDLNKLEENSVELEKPNHNVETPGNITITLKVKGAVKPVIKQELTKEQRLMLEDVEMPKTRSVLDDWVLVNFTAEEVTRFAELVKYQPGWLDDSVEVQKGCKMM